MWVRLEYHRPVLLAGLLAIIATYLAIDHPPEILIGASLSFVPANVYDLTQALRDPTSDRILLPPLRPAPSP